MFQLSFISMKVNDNMLKKADESTDVNLYSESIDGTINMGFII